MQLPQKLQHFPNGALIVASDTVLANIFLVGNDAIEELDGVAVPKETGVDGEGSFEFFPDDATRLHSFAKKLAEQITALTREHEIPHIHFVMPTEIEHLATKNLPPDVAAKIGKKIHHDVMKEDPISIVTRVVASFGTEK